MSRSIQIKPGVRVAMAAIMVALTGLAVGGCASLDRQNVQVAEAAQAAGRPLEAAIRRGDLPRFSSLLDSGADPLQANDEGDTVVHLAAAAETPAFLKALLLRGVDPDALNTVTARTPLMSALVAERDLQIEWLLAAGVDLSRADRTGNTALHVAAQINDPGKVLRLLEAGAPVEARNAQGQTFQRYLYMTRVQLLDRKAAEDLTQVTAWLSARGQLDGSPEGSVS